MMLDREAFGNVVSQMETMRPHGLEMLGLHVSSPRGVFEHHFSSNEPQEGNLRSISKLPIALALGVAMQRGVQIYGRPLSLDTKVWSTFERFLALQSEDSQALFKQVEIRHLVSNTIGHAEGFLFRSDIKDVPSSDLLPYIFSKDLEFPPGEHFSYSNVGWYLLSVMIKEELGSNLTDWVSGHIFDPVGVRDANWAMYGEYEAAATGLELTVEDLAKLGQILLHSGAFNGRQVVPAEWITTIRSPIVRASSGYDPSSPLQAVAYSYGAWICPNGVVYCDGSGGQFLIVDPQEGLVIAALAKSGDTLSVSRCLAEILR